jgi:hypothetical protein
MLQSVSAPNPPSCAHYGLHPYRHLLFHESHLGVHHGLLDQNDENHPSMNSIEMYQSFAVNSHHHENHFEFSQNENHHLEVTLKKTCRGLLFLNFC